MEKEYDVFEFRTEMADFIEKKKNNKNDKNHVETDESNKETDKYEAIFVVFCFGSFCFVRVYIFM